MPRQPACPDALLRMACAPIGAALLLLATAASAATSPAPCAPGEASFFKDEGLTIKVTTKLQFQKALLREKIHAKATGGAVMLWGGVSSPEVIRLAGELASQVDGVRCVQNLLKVGPPDDSDPPR